MSFPETTTPVPQSIVLAPMEGLADYQVRRAITAAGGFDWCVSEFVRVSGQRLPGRVFRRWCPELREGCQTASGTPVHLQLLGSDAESMAENAQRALREGAQAVDLNFGCPAKTVNRHRGGAVLLDEPEVVYQVVCAVRNALPKEITVSAKMRLGNLDSSRALENAQAIESAGADWLTVHGRTKVQGYKPPAWWDQIGLINEGVRIPVIANGEIWNCEDARLCMQESGCLQLMLGRGAVADPFLAMRLRKPDMFSCERAHWQAVLDLLCVYAQTVIEEMKDSPARPEQVAGRIKQWLNYMRRRWPAAQQEYQHIRKMQRPEAILKQLQASIQRLAVA